MKKKSNINDSVSSDISNVIREEFEMFPSVKRVEEFSSKSLIKPLEEHSVAGAMNNSVATELNYQDNVKPNIKESKINKIEESSNSVDSI